jgi:cytochrome c peroxidase
MVSYKNAKSADWKGIKAQIKKVMKQPEYDDGSAGPVFVR